MPELHFPPAGTWARADASDLGFDVEALRAAIRHATDHETPWPVDVGGMVAKDDPAPFNRPIGPTRPRGPATGLVVKDGWIVGEWGEPARVDMTFSATKSYVSTCVGLALDRGLIDDLDEPVCNRVPDEFSGEHNGLVTWRHLLHQTSEWSGTLFGIPDTVDHNRSAPDAPARKGIPRPLQPPGTFWEYNDVRVNALALAALRIWREPLPDVLAREVMQPIGASSDWRWEAYDNATVAIAGRDMASVPGGGHWGGGLMIDSFDHARFGLLWLAHGEWDGRRILPESWIRAALSACPHNDRYGFMWWLNPVQSVWPNASEGAFAAIGAGGNVVFVAPERQLVVVTRWAANPNNVIDRVLSALQ